ncbi:Gep5p NDAI_0B02010 [Naumovozyma dairenensis CBS 421]|uniref:Genetic interactor of prohibitin 5, mitochondrial n=1 Tax=Naumovozyma dairenensis (strain ATCC 10597 / BCRC 20456 / CBS 421 / NBRC 0211 / NRRL Y-12639) TaxID=1071378 RepID=G0W625_NAUDC|nr:hypothetical protein NDAI_0B02010 [Naumovozyma dairenensis CBS 421]CCD23236.1 hypothetical protein NDAI_0B02010 [Naumovozyma dairenensis CBS 421]
MELLNSKLTKTLLSSLQNLPLHSNTLAQLERKCLTRNIKATKSFKIPLLTLINSYEKAQASGQSKLSNKTLESIIYHTYFEWTNDLASHLKPFQRQYSTLLTFWPHIYHSKIDSKKNSIILTWNKSSNSKNMLRELLSHLNYTQSLVPQKKDFQVIFKKIYQHYIFLSLNPSLCSNGKRLPSPIVEIPMNAMGYDIPKKRINNLLRSKIARTWNYLAITNPILNLENEAQLDEIINGSSAIKSRQLRKLYRRACSNSYVIKNEDDNNIEFQKSKKLNWLNF